MTTPTELPMVITLPEPEEVQASSEPVSDDSGINWAEEAGEKGDNSVDDVVEAVEGELEVIAAPEVITPPAAEVIPTAPAIAAPTEPVAVAPVVPPVAEPAQVAPAPVLPVTPPFDMAKWEAEQLTGLEQLYAINSADAERLQTEPELIMPKLAANMHMSITKSLLTAVQAMIPDYVNQHNQIHAADQEARNAFYSVNADLKDHEASVMQVAKIFRAANPKASREVAIKTIGDMVRMSMGLPAPTTPPPAQTLQAVITPPVNRPFTPARGGGQAPVKAPNMWEEMIADD